MDRPYQEPSPEPSDLPLLGRLYPRMLLIRLFEERVLQLFSEGHLSGTTHAYIGEEAVAAGLFDHLTADDVIFSNHRCHGHYLMHQDDPEGLMAEMMGRATGTCGGWGGSQHLQRGNFYSNGVQGGIVPAALGMARAGAPLVAVFLGDGTLGEGQVYESFNLASLWKQPVLFVIEHNGWSQSTPSRLQIAGEAAERPRAFGIPTTEVHSNDVQVTWDRAGQAVAAVRRGEGPQCLVFHTFRLCSHSRSDDARPEEAIAPWRALDPLRLAEAQLEPAFVAACREQAASRVEAAVRTSLDGPSPAPFQSMELSVRPVAGPAPVAGEKVVSALNRGLHFLLAQDPRVVVLGEDMLDPYGGAFKVSRGLSTAFPDRVLATPVSEGAITGMAAGMALRGMRPVLEIMFGDFLTLCVDGLVNYAAKFRGMYHRQVNCPLVLRTPMGARRGYGPTHSQSLERLVLGIPDLRVVAVNPLVDPARLLCTAVLGDDAPVLFVENKLLYTVAVRPPDAEGWWGNFRCTVTDDPYPTAFLSLGSEALLVTYGGMTELTLAAAEELLLEHELACEVAVLSELQPLPVGVLEPALARCRGRLVTVEEGMTGWGWGAEVVAACSERGWVRRSGRVGAKAGVIPAARVLEDQMLPGKDEIVAAVLRCLR